MAKSDVYGNSDSVFGGSTTEAPAPKRPAYNRNGVRQYQEDKKRAKEAYDATPEGIAENTRIRNEAIGKGLGISYKAPVAADSGLDLPSRDETVMGVLTQQLETMKKRRKGGQLGGFTSDLGGGGGDLSESVESLLFGV